MRDRRGDDQGEHDRRGLQRDREQARRPAQQGANASPCAAPNTSAKPSVAASAPAIRISELTTPSLNSDQAGAVFSIGRVRSMPVHRFEPGLEGRHAAGEGRRLQLGVERRQDAGVVGAARARCCSPGAAQTACCCSRKAVPMRCWRPSSRNMPSRWKIWLIRSSARASLSLPSRAPPCPTAPGRSRTSGRSARRRRIGEGLGEEAVVLCGQRAGLVLQPLGQHARLVEQHEPRALGDQLGVGAVADGDADGAAGNVLPVRYRSARGPTTVVSDR